MAKQTTRDAALSRLFGNAPRSAPGPPKPGATGKLQPPTESDADAARAEERSGQVKAAAPIAATRGGGEGAGAASSRSEADRSPSGYIGMGRYSRSDGVVERITPYVRPDQAEALRIAVARKSDPRGTDISQIIQSLLDEAGYNS